MKRYPVISSGFTLIELVVTIAIGAILMMVAVPSFREFQRNSELTSIANTLLSAANAARGEAMKRGAYAFVIPSDGSNWANGLTVFVDKNLDQAFTAGTDDVTFVTPAPSGFISIEGVGSGTTTAASPYILFDGSGYPKDKGGGFGATTLVIKRTDVTDSQQLVQTRKMIISRAGRVRICRPDQDTTCSDAATE